MRRVLREAASHALARDCLLDRCFGPGRFLKTSEALRHGRRPAAGLAFVLVEDDRLIGTLRFWNIAAGTAGPALLLGPLAVLPERQGLGLGALLMRHGLAQARRLGHAAVLLVGDAPYYARFGFGPELTQGLTLPGPVDRRRFLGLELLPGALRGASGDVVATGAYATTPDMVDVVSPSAERRQGQGSDPAHSSASRG